MFPATFLGGSAGLWRVEHILPISGKALPDVQRLDVRTGLDPAADGGWVLRGVAGSARYVEKREKVQLDAVSPPLGRAEATQARLIPVRKSEAWWALAQDERRAIFEARSHHIAGSLEYLPRIARRLYHSRDLGEPFDFLTWFEFAPEHAPAFDELLATVRATEEWSFVEREVEIRLSRDRE
jgi:hypothetical protein